jgi:hypothetical protein
MTAVGQALRCCNQETTCSEREQQAVQTTFPILLTLTGRLRIDAGGTHECSYIWRYRGSGNGTNSLLALPFTLGPGRRRTYSLFAPFPVSSASIIPHTAPRRFSVWGCRELNGIAFSSEAVPSRRRRSQKHTVEAPHSDGNTFGHVAAACVRQNNT